MDSQLQSVSLVEVKLLANINTDEIGKPKKEKESDAINDVVTSLRPAGTDHTHRPNMLVKITHVVIRNLRKMCPNLKRTPKAKIRSSQLHHVKPSVSLFTDTRTLSLCLSLSDVALRGK